MTESENQGPEVPGDSNAKGPLAPGMAPQDLAPHLLGIFSEKLRSHEGADEKC